MGRPDKPCRLTEGLGLGYYAQQTGIEISSIFSGWYRQKNHKLGCAEPNKPLLTATGAVMVQTNDEARPLPINVG
jgi:hypothetical protein